MNKELLQKIIAFRRDIHEHPEVGFNQFQTVKKIKNLLLQLGVPQQSITLISKEGKEPVGIVVDLQGQAKPEGEPFKLAYRADLDALDMVEQNPNLPYVSKNKGVAHMCGHDGHTACLVGFVPWFLSNSPKIPSNKSLRLIFQPSQQGPESGAVLMIEKGCLERVNQIYCMHNVPLGSLGQIYVKPGIMLANTKYIKIKIKGDGGHGSSTKNLRMSIWRSMKFYKKLMKFVKKKKQQGRKLQCIFPVFQAGQRYNVISQTTTIMGNLRAFDRETMDLIFNKMKSLLKKVEKQGFEVELKVDQYISAINAQKQTNNFIKIAKQLFGDDKITDGGILPVYAADDFAYYLEKVPGTYFFFCTAERKGMPFVHAPNFDFNDNSIQWVHKLWVALAKNRLNLNDLL